MPNWCSNKLRLIAKTDEAKALLPSLVEGFQPSVEASESAFELICPTPEELLSRKAPEDDPFVAEENEAKYGASDWYNWRVKNWGTKWESSNEEVEEIPCGLIAAFETAWSPPIGIYAKLIAMGFDVYATYIECGTGYAGIWDNGEDQEFKTKLPDNDDPWNDTYIVLSSTFKGIPSEFWPHGLGG